MQKKLIVFDLDGTLYKLRGGSYNKSPLKKKVLVNAQNFVALKLSKNKTEAKNIINLIQKKYGEQISIGLEKEFGINRYDYFNTVWDIPAKGIVRRTKNLRGLLLSLKKECRLVIVSDAPLVWIKNVLKELGIEDIFQGMVFSGEGDRRKEFDNIFYYISKTLKISPLDCIVIGDQEDTDVIPAKKLCMKTVFIHSKLQSREADLSIKSIQSLLTKIKKLL